jgi:hypothetical protein
LSWVLLLNINPPRGKLYVNVVSSWKIELVENIVSREAGEIDNPKPKNMDKEFMNQVLIDSTIDLIEIVELKIDIKDKLGLLSYKLIKEDVLDLS